MQIPTCAQDFDKNNNNLIANCFAATPNVCTQATQSNGKPRPLSCLLRIRHCRAAAENAVWLPENVWPCRLFAGTNSHLCPGLCAKKHNLMANRLAATPRNLCTQNFDQTTQSNSKLHNLIANRLAATPNACTQDQVEQKTQSNGKPPRCYSECLYPGL